MLQYFMFYILYFKYLVFVFAEDYIQVALFYSIEVSVDNGVQAEKAVD